jgi:hypothetical protein
MSSGGRFQTRSCTRASSASLASSGTIRAGLPLGGRGPGGALESWIGPGLGGRDGLGGGGVLEDTRPALGGLDALGAGALEPRAAQRGQSLAVSAKYFSLQVGHVTDARAVLIPPPRSSPRASLTATRAQRKSPHPLVTPLPPGAREGRSAIGEARVLPTRACPL